MLVKKQNVFPVCYLTVGDIKQMDPNASNYDLRTSKHFDWTIGYAKYLGFIGVNTDVLNVIQLDEFEKRQKKSKFKNR